MIPGEEARAPGAMSMQFGILVLETASEKEDHSLPPFYTLFSTSLSLSPSLFPSLFSLPLSLSSLPLPCGLRVLVANVSCGM